MSIASLSLCLLGAAVLGQASPPKPHLHVLFEDEREGGKLKPYGGTVCSRQALLQWKGATPPRRPQTGQHCGGAEEIGSLGRAAIVEFSVESGDSQYQAQPKELESGE